MSETIPQKLRAVASVAKPEDDGVTYGLAGWCRIAADEIERLERENNTLRDHLATVGLAP